MYRWSHIKGPGQALIVSDTNSTTQINKLVQGVYEFILKVSDNLGGTVTDTVQVTVKAGTNQQLMANAGTDQVLNVPANGTTLTGTGFAFDGLITQYLWRMISGPSTTSIAFANAASTAVTGLQIGTYVFELTITDDKL